jgi:Flp pilus assembly pilin Flp
VDNRESRALSGGGSILHVKGESPMLKDLALRVLVAVKGLESKVKDEEGQTLAEYGMIMAVIAVGVIVAAGLVFRDAIVGAFTDATDCLDGTCS